MFAVHANLLHYFVALAAVAVAFTVRFLLDPALGDVAQFLLFSLSVVVAAWSGGLGPGLLATTVSAILGDYFFIDQPHSIYTKHSAERLELGLFIGVGISISILSQARLSAEAKRQQLLVSEREARKMAEDANSLKDEFLATVSHELRTPLASISGWAKLLRVGNLDAERAARALETIERNAQSQNQLINDLLDVSRIITGKMSLDIGLLHLGSVIESAVETVRPAADAKGIRLNVLLDPAAESVSGDAHRLQQVVWNLLSNAIKFAPKGGRVDVRLERINSQVEITVADNGQGIKPEFLPYVFDRFRQEDGGASRRQGGLGRGLAIVRHMVELHGGTVRAASKGLGKGATFTVVLPIKPGRAVSPVDRRERAAGESERLTPENPLSVAGVRALLVEDEADARELITAMLVQGGVEVRTACSAAAALAAFDEWRPDILISDIGMPGEDGYMLMKKWRERESARGLHIPAIALTAYARPEDRQRALSVGYESHVPKPVAPEELLAVVASLTNRN